MTPRILIATPVDGNPDTASVSLAYHSGVRAAEREMVAEVVPYALAFSDDLARARSRAVYYALERDTWDYVLWWDDDVAVQNVSVIQHMVDRMQSDGHDVLGAPYPRKRILATFPYKPLDAALKSKRIEVKNDCVEVELLAFGFMLTSRACLQLMVDHYRESDWFSDGTPTDRREVVAVFRQVMTDKMSLPDGGRFRELYSEDYSFCHRWRAIGGKVQMYVGPGAPLGHVGMHKFIGSRDEIGRVF